MSDGVLASKCWSNKPLGLPNALNFLYISPPMSTLLLPQKQRQPQWFCQLHSPSPDLHHKPSLGVWAMLRLLRAVPNIPLSSSLWGKGLGHPLASLRQWIIRMISLKRYGLCNTLPHSSPLFLLLAQFYLLVYQTRWTYTMCKPFHLVFWEIGNLRLINIYP